MVRRRSTVRFRKGALVRVRSKIRWAGRCEAGVCDGDVAVGGARPQCGASNVPPEGIWQGHGQVAGPKWRGFRGTIVWRLGLARPPRNVSRSKYDSTGDLQVFLFVRRHACVLGDQAAQDGFSADLLCVDVGHSGVGSVMFVVGDALDDALVRPRGVVVHLRIRPGRRAGAPCRGSARDRGARDAACQRGARRSRSSAEPGRRCAGSWCRWPSNTVSNEAASQALRVRTGAHGVIREVEEETEQRVRDERRRRGGRTLRCWLTRRHRSPRREPPPCRRESPSLSRCDEGLPPMMSCSRDRWQARTSTSRQGQSSAWPA